MRHQLGISSGDTACTVSTQQATPKQFPHTASLLLGGTRDFRYSDFCTTIDNSIVVISSNQPTSDCETTSVKTWKSEVYVWGSTAEYLNGGGYGWPQATKYRFPLIVHNGTNFNASEIRIRCGYHTAGLIQTRYNSTKGGNENSLFAWGDNQRGNVASMDVLEAVVPREVVELGEDRFEVIGFQLSNSALLAVLRNGTILSMGGQSQGLLGYDSSDSRPGVFGTVLGDLYWNETVKGNIPYELSMQTPGMFATYQEDDTNDVRLYCWGLHRGYCALTSEKSVDQFLPMYVDFHPWVPNVTAALQIGGFDMVVALFETDSGSGPLRRLYTWGSGDDRMLGHGIVGGNSGIPREVEWEGTAWSGPLIDPVFTFTAAQKTIRFICSSGAVFAFGQNTYYGVVGEWWNNWFVEPMRILDAWNVSFGPSTEYGSHFAFTLDYSCFGVLPTDALVCSQHGTCNSQDECTCFGFYSGTECLTPFSCFGVYETHPSACSGFGTCIAPDECVCDEFHGTEDCSQFRCGGILSTLTSVVCSGKGTCVSIDDCECFGRSYGEICEIMIAEQGHFAAEDHREVRIPYVTSLASLARVDRLGTFSCDLVLQNVSEIAHPDDNPTCFFDYVTEDSSELVIEVPDGLSSNLQPDEVIWVLAVSRVGQYADVRIAEFVEEKSGFLTIFLSVFFVVVLLIATIIATLAIVFALLKIRRQKTLLEKFDRLTVTDIDLMLEEQEDQVDLAKLRLDPSLFSVNYDEIQVKRKIGAGGSSAVCFLVHWKGHEACFKCFRTSEICRDEHSFEEFEKEVRLLASVSHKYILRWFGAVLRPPRVGAFHFGIHFDLAGILMEYCEQSDLNAYLADRADLPFRERLRIATAIAGGISYLHGLNIIHRDIKTQNIFMTGDEPRLGDFGLSKLVSSLSQTKTRRIGTSIYMAPEMTRGDNYDVSVDVFAFGILLYILFTGDMDPYAKTSGSSLVSSIEFAVANDERFRPPIAAFAETAFEGAHWLLDLIERSWAASPDDRPSSTSILESLERKRALEPTKAAQSQSQSGSGGSESSLVSRLREEIEQLRSENRSLREKVSTLSQELRTTGERGNGEDIEDESS